MSKLTYASRNHAGGFDLHLERDAGNEITILTGSYECSLEFWQILKALCEDITYTMTHEEED